MLVLKDGNSNPCRSPKLCLLMPIPNYSRCSSDPADEAFGERLAKMMSSRTPTPVSNEYIEKLSGEIDLQSHSVVTSEDKVTLSAWRYKSSSEVPPVKMPPYAHTQDAADNEQEAPKQERTMEKSTPYERRKPDRLSCTNQLREAGINIFGTLSGVIGVSKDAVTGNAKRSLFVEEYTMCRTTPDLLFLVPDNVIVSTVYKSGLDQFAQYSTSIRGTFEITTWTRFALRSEHSSVKNTQQAATAKF